MHKVAQEKGKAEWYKTFGLRVSKVERDYFLQYKIDEMIKAKGSAFSAIYGLEDAPLGYQLVCLCHGHVYSGFSWIYRLHFLNRLL